MKSYIFAVLSAALFVAQASAQTLTVNTPTNVLSCTALIITWSGGTSPYILSVHDGTDVNGAALVTFTNLTGTSYTWSSVTFAPNTNLDLTLRDSAGDESQSAPFSVQSGGPTTCLNTTGTTTPLTIAASNTGASAATSAAGSTTNSAGSSAGTSGTPKGSSAGSSAGTSATSASKPASSSSAATPIGVSYGVAGVIGAAIAAVFV